MNSNFCIRHIYIVGIYTQYIVLASQIQKQLKQMKLKFKSIINKIKIVFIFTPLILPEMSSTKIRYTSSDVWMISKVGTVLVVGGKMILSKIKKNIVSGGWKKIFWKLY